MNSIQSSANKNQNKNHTFALNNDNKEKKKNKTGKTHPDKIKFISPTYIISDG